ncbi:DUF2384 domain-containing protein [Arthrobacter sp. Sa2CUA1]|uniref:DUF2384 domain-containing protein n=1 Tax=Arthrobacter gallicola TaxID=2762225 RepID=A0ABR8UQ56_9MICC|nr:MbcA/ParS/Xre antitoxin family protein [Arthrobacter gallicola]MBD7994653.1 DUF2384 domain-containing protein [Arthrobacter gallicola]
MTSPSVSRRGSRTSVTGARRGSRLSGAQQRTELLIEAFGSTTVVAEVLGVSPSQPSRWSRGLESPGLEAGRLVVDLDHVMARARMIWSRDAALQWLQGSNSYLDGARPIDVLKTRGSAEVIAALDAAQSGAFG